MSREQVIINHLPLVHAIVKQFKPPRAYYEDMQQAGVVGLCIAYDKYKNKERSVSFGTYAGFYIKNEISKAMPNVIPVNISDRTRRNFVLYIRKCKKAEVDLARPLYPSEIVLILEELNLSENMKKSIVALTLQTDEIENLTSNTCMESDVELSDLIDKIRAALTDEEWYIIDNMYISDDQTYDQIAFSLEKPIHTIRRIAKIAKEKILVVMR